MPLVLPMLYSSISISVKPFFQKSLSSKILLLCPHEVSLIEQRTTFINQLRHAFSEYYPSALEAFEYSTSVSASMFFLRFPTPYLLALAGKR